MQAVACLPPFWPVAVNARFLATIACVGPFWRSQLHHHLLGYAAKGFAKGAAGRARIADGRTPDRKAD